MRQQYKIIEDIDKITKYQDLTIEFERLWHKLALVVLVLIGITMPKNTGRIDKISICWLQKTTLLASAHILCWYIFTS